jgi:hypothetical protein
MRYYGLYAEAIYRTDQHGDVLVEGRRDGSFTVTHWDQRGNTIGRTFSPPEQP